MTSILFDRIFSGVRPTGHIHIGNYLGAITNWVNISQQAKETYFCIVDQHALTTLTDRTNLKENSLIMAATYIACGIDPKKNVIFVQSHVPFHTELSWYLTCHTPMGWLSRMTQFKDKAGKNKDQALTGLFAYPILMASDILLYKASHVPVGDDQKQHVEFTRDICTLFNHSVNEDVLKMPEPYIQKSGARIKSLRDGTKKMSKSDISDYSRIHLNDADDLIVQKIKKAKTDAFPITNNLKDLENRPELENFVTMISILQNKTKQDCLNQFDGKQFSDIKKELIECLILHISPIRHQIHALLKDKFALESILKQGATKAKESASSTIQDVRKTLGLLT